jgi:histidyl-tRNA synthetase
MWRFQDPWSERVYALRYDLTVPLARFVAMHRDMPLPFKRYHIAPVWRHEEPQRRRYREFYQCDADIVGSIYPEADAEILNLADSVLREFGLSNYKILVNDRRILRGVFEEELGIQDPFPIYRAIDKLDKIGFDGVRRELARIGVSSGIIDRILDLIGIEGDLADSARKLKNMYSSNPHVSEGADFIEEIASSLKTDKAVFSMSLVRGLDYYTGPIFEVVVDKPKIGSIAGGGRYDNLIGLFTEKDIPATGISIGVERLIDAGLELGLFRLEKKTYTEVFIVNLDPTDRRIKEYTSMIADKLRGAGINTMTDLMRRSPAKQREYARKLNIPILIFIGSKEIGSNTVAVYSTKHGKRLVVDLENIVETIEDLIRGEE